ITSSNDEIHIQAKDSIVLKAGQSSVTLKGGDITFACPGTFSVKGSGNAFVGPGSQAAEISRLPNGQVQLFDEAFVIKDPAGNPIRNLPYKISASDGVIYGKTSDNGESQRVGTDASESLKFEIQWHELDS
ncbi:DUF2345 domain-containing protein, partial [Nitrogeniibacter aestuarii]|uniref:DUF2345 domain-containing protein n=1 Tax=Nitrogeniibacter aestuarii TaxID=2815343 RepID=UPI001D116170